MTAVGFVVDFNDIVQIESTAKVFKLRKSYIERSWIVIRIIHTTSFFVSKKLKENVFQKNSSFFLSLSQTLRRLKRRGSQEQQGYFCTEKEAVKRTQRERGEGG